MIKAIETHYKGYRFRSRLEARWAVFFDDLRLRWEYETEGFDIDGTRYLPDFRVWTPQGEPMWYEVKPAHILSDTKFERFRRAIEDERGMQTRVSLLSGDPLEHLERRWHAPTNGCAMSNDFCPRCAFFHPAAYGIYFQRGCAREDVSFGCEPCDAETPGGGQNELQEGFARTMVRPYKGSLLIDEMAYDRVKFIVESAALAARSARFEHGEATVS